MKRKLIYAPILALALVVLLCAGSVPKPRCCPPTDLPPTETSIPPNTQIPTNPPKDTPTSPPSSTDTPEYTSTPGITVDPTPTKATDTRKPPRVNLEKTPTIVETLPVTGGGLPPNIGLGLTLIGLIILLFIAIMARISRRSNEEM